MRAEGVGILPRDRGLHERQLGGEIAQRARPRVGLRVRIVALGVVRELFWGALGTEVVGVSPASVVALVGSRDDGRDELALLA